MTDYISREAFLEQTRKRYCEDCSRRKGMKNGKYKTLYEIGEAPCRACEIDDVLNDVEGFPAADVRPVVNAAWYGEANGYADGELVYDMWSCPVCRKRFEEWEEKPDWNFCPNCGADMMEDKT